MARSTAYSFINVTATVDGREVKGVWEGDDAIVVTQATDEGTGLVGADGSSIFSVSANFSGTITIRLQHTSPTHEFLTKRRLRQRALGGNTSEFTFTVKDKVSKEGFTARKCFIQTAPEGSYGMNATVREWVLYSGEITPEVPVA